MNSTSSASSSAKNISNSFKITPLGGVGQIGSNMTLLASENDTILIDAGILFPSEDFFDIDHLIPSLESIPTPEYLIITHGHEDHIGAIHHILRRYPNIVVYAPPFPARLIRKKLDHQKLGHKIHDFQIDDQLTFNDLTINPIHVNHSIPETTGLLIQDHNKYLSLFFASDFKIDFKTHYERPFDFEKLVKLSSGSQKRILFCDSTNITSSQTSTPSELEIFPIFQKLFSEAKGRIFITCFSSNIHRILSILTAAHALGKKVVPHGRSMLGYIQTAIEHGIIAELSQTIIFPDDLKTPQDAGLVILLSGCQGDFRGTFRRFAMGEDSLFKPIASDSLIVSSKPIPGNEKKISSLINKISHLGCTIITPQDELVHVSGHPGKDDLKILYNKYSPTDIFPIHGEAYFIREHISFVKECFQQANTYYLNNFDTVQFDFLTDSSNSLAISIQDNEATDPVIYHGNNIILEREKISERRKLAATGSCFLTIKTHRLSTINLNDPTAITLSTLGLPNYPDISNDNLKAFIINHLAHIGLKNPDETKEQLRIALRKYFNLHLGYKPVTTIHLI